MIGINRRSFLHSALMISGAPFVTAIGNAVPKKKNKGEDAISLGIIARADNPEEDLKIVRDLGFPTCQLNVKEYSPELAKRLRATLEKYYISPVTLICMGPGVYTYNFKEGPSTIGLIPRETRPARIKRLKEGIDFCKAAGIPAVHAHFGFIPENPDDVLYVEFIALMKDLGAYSLKNGIDIYFETGQETPVTLLRAIEDIGTGNLYVNCDLANLVLYGKANPLDGVKMLAKYIRSFHAKDGLYPTDPYKLGKEVLIPNGEVKFPEIIAFLKSINFKGNITLECELSGTNSDYISKTKKYLETLIDA
ncbi:MAG: sugar phosphate isomerase/epimerase [Chitinophagaceae bacterium]|nr:sugar phosphate isomerase/epimerase [Chitinophagaceae bacterium]